MFVLASSVLCFTLEKDWFKGISAHAKIPSYALLGISIAFSFVYTVLDLLQALIDTYREKYLLYFSAMSKLKKP